MKFFSAILVTMAGLAAAKGHQGAAAGNSTMPHGKVAHNNGTAHHGKAGHSSAGSTMAQCREMAKLTHLVDLANNQTKLDKATHNNATKESAIKAEASTAATKLSAMQSNATLMATCSEVFAADAMRASCHKMASLEHLAALVANATALADKTKNNATKAAELQAKASADAGTLSSLQGNATLTQFCSVENTKATCHAMASMQKTAAEAANATWLDTHFKGDQAKITAFKDRAAKEQTRLATLQGNSTLTSACSALGSKSQDSSSTTSSGAGSSSSSNSPAKGGAGTVQPLVAMTSLSAVLIAGVLLL